MKKILALLSILACLIAGMVGYVTSAAYNSENYPAQARFTEFVKKKWDAQVTRVTCVNVVGQVDAFCVGEVAFKSGNFQKVSYLCGKEIFTWRGRGCYRPKRT